MFTILSASVFWWMLFSQKQLPTVGRNLVDDFLKLQHEIDLFAKDFQVYLDKKKQELDGDAIRYKDELDRLTAILEGYVLRSRFDLVLKFLNPLLSLENSVNCFRTCKISLIRNICFSIGQTSTPRCGMRRCLWGMYIPRYSTSNLNAAHVLVLARTAVDRSRRACRIYNRAQQ